ncbi:FAD-dependent oxidoreductase [Prosthecobacter sp. SYSU 5D2]|uniref:FAD-dependent oxidoreductase n=1 Tax=Prosthecobacter sp. SYSU 5D2 TaxID=3134134 RepID=UPI0031FE9C34
MRVPTCLFALLSFNLAVQAATSEHDVVIYGGTCAAITSAVQVKKMGKSVIIVSPDKHLGGLSSGGLGYTDTGNKAVIGGLSREFYHRIFMHYQKDESWVQQKKDEYGNKGQGTPAMDGENRTMWIFEPSAAEKIFEAWIKENDITVVRDAWLDRAKGVKKEGDKIVAITTLDGNTYAGKMFIDTTYEGDLMAAAGVDYHVGREANSVYGEEHNGVQVGILHHHHHFGDMKMSPYKIPGDPKSGVLARISTEPPGNKGEGDKRVQAYCFRSCYTNDPSNRIPFPKPEGYDASQYELLLRVLQTGWDGFFNKFDPVPNHKTDTNNHGPFSFDNIGYNYDYPEASYERRKEIIEEHRIYQQGLMWFVANDPRVPKKLQEELNTWGLPKDEFTDNGNWSHQLYIREARRMIGHFVMTENELRKMKPTPDSVGMGSYTIDSHNVQRYITPEGHVQNEGDIGVSTNGPYAIAYGSLVPKEGQGSNLLVPVAMSASHIAYGSIRMEPVFMILGQSAASAAVIAIDDGLAVQKVPYAKLREQLVKDGQILEYSGPSSSRGVDPKSMKGIVIDDTQAIKTGSWARGAAAKKFISDGYSHDGNTGKGQSSATFRAQLPKAGKYEVILAYAPNNNRASNVPVTIKYQGGEAKVTVNQKKDVDVDGLGVSLGTFEFGADSEVIISTEGTDGYVVVDGVQWIAK